MEESIGCCDTAQLVIYIFEALTRTLILVKNLQKEREVFRSILVDLDI